MPPALSAMALALPADLSAADAEALTALYQRGTPPNTLRAWERDLIYIAAWKKLAFGRPLVWPEDDRVALRFILDHSVDLTHATQTAAQAVAKGLIDLGLRRSLACPAPATLDRRIASWRAFHRMRNLPSPFQQPLVAQSRIKARAAAARPVAPKSARPITREVLEKLLASCDDTLRGLRDRAMLTLAFASGGRRRSEVCALYREDIDTRDWADKGVIWITLLSTKTTRADTAPRLPLKGRAARALIGWIIASRIEKGPLFRPISTADRALPRQLAPDALGVIVKHRLGLAGLPATYASAHGLRSGFLTQAALDGAPLAAAMQLSLHRSVVQAQRYYADVEISDNPATALLD